MTVKERLQKLYNHYDTNSTRVAYNINEKFPETNFNRQTLYNIENNKTDTFSVKTAETLLKVFPKVNPLWLLLGKGEMLLETKPVKENKKDTIEIIIKSNEIETSVKIEKSEILTRLIKLISL